MLAAIIESVHVCQVYRRKDEQKTDFLKENCIFVKCKARLGAYREIDHFDTIHVQHRYNKILVYALFEYGYNTSTRSIPHCRVGDVRAIDVSTVRYVINTPWIACG